MKNRLFVVILLVILVVSCVCACSEKSSESSFPDGAIELNTNNLTDYFDIKTDDDYDFSNHSSVVTLKLAFVPKYKFDDCNVEIEYSHDAKWNYQLGTPVVVGEKKAVITSVNGFSTTCNGGYSGQQYYIRNNTITVISVKGYVIKSSNQPQMQVPSESGSEELRRRLEAFTESFSKSEEISYTSSNNFTLTTVFGDTKNTSSEQKLQLRRSTSEYNVSSADLKMGNGCFIKGEKFYSESLSQEGISIQEAVSELVGADLANYNNSLVPYLASDKLGTVQKIDENSYKAKNILSNIRFADDSMTLKPSTYYGFTQKDYSLFNVEASYTFDDNKLTVCYSVDLFQTFDKVKTYNLKITRTYVVDDTFERLIDKYPVKPQRDAQTALEFFNPIDVADSRIVTVEYPTYDPSWIAVDFERGMYIVSGEECTVGIFHTDGETYANTSPKKPTLLEGLYLLRIKTDYGYEEDTVRLCIEKKNWQTLPDYDNPTMMNSDGKISGTVEGYGDEEIYTFVAIEDGCYSVKGSPDNLEVTFISSDGMERYLYVKNDERIIQLVKGEYTVIVGTNWVMAEKFNYELKIEKSEHQPDNSACITDSDTELFIFNYRTLNGNTELFYATFTVSEGGTYRFVFSDEINFNTSMVFDEEDNHYYSDADGYVLDAGTYTVAITAYKNGAVNVRYELVQ